jgi:hypothetical protein
MDLFNSTVLPFFFMTLLSFVVIYVVKRSRSRVGAGINISIAPKNTLTHTEAVADSTMMMAKRATVFTLALATKENDFSSSIVKGGGNYAVVSNNTYLSTKTRDRKFAITILALNLIFLLLNLPITIYDQYTSFVNVDSEVNAILSYLFMNLWYLYYVIGFYAHMAVNNVFRNEFFVLLKLRPMRGANDFGEMFSVTNTVKEKKINEIFQR